MKKEKNNIKKKKWLIWAVVIGALLIPFMYSFFYLKAFWNPYKSLNQIPVAIVNLDGENNTKGQELTEKIVNQKILKSSVVSKKNALNRLKKEKYYAIITIPKNFTESLESVSTNSKTHPVITYEPDERGNYLASQIIEKVVEAIQGELNSEAGSQIVSTLVGKLGEVPTQLEKIDQGLTEIDNGTNQLTEGSKDINSGLEELNSNYALFNDGVIDAKNGINSLTSYMEQLNQGINEYTDGTVEYAKNVTTLAFNIDGLSEKIIEFGNNNPEALKNSNELAELYAIATLLRTPDETGLTKLQQLEQAGGQIITNGPTVKASTNQINNGIKQLNTGVNTLSEKSVLVKDGITKLTYGSRNLYNGMLSLDTGVNSAKEQLTSGISDTKKELTKLNGLSEYTKQPVKVKQSNYTEVAAYGLGFAPYFMSLSLWVGALMLLVELFYDVEDRFKLFSRNNKKRVQRTFAYLGLACIQAIVLGIFLKLGLGYSVDNYALYFGTLILISIAFISIIEFLIVHFDDIGKFIAILFLVLQLASSGGTFPIETVPSIFRSIYNFMPMKYTIALIKQSIVKIDGNILSKNLLVIVGIIVVFMTINIVTDIIKNKKDTVK